VSVTVGFVVYLWHTGRTATSAPGWLRSDAEREDELGALVTADAIVAALRHLPISAMKTAMTSMRCYRRRDVSRPGTCSARCAT
jgi:hypothetical protein